MAHIVVRDVSPKAANVLGGSGCRAWFYIGIVGRGCVECGFGFLSTAFRPFLVFRCMHGWHFVPFGYFLWRWLGEGVICFLGFLGTR